MLNLFIASGTAAAPAGAPGERFHYSDTAFVLLGVLLELVTGRRYHELQREQILAPLSLAGTSMAYRDDTSPTARDEEMDIWFGPTPLLSDGFDVSFDWGGGGQVSTVRDVIRFLQAVLDPTSALLDDSCRLTQWSTPTGLTSPRREVGLGLFRWEAGGRVVVGHAGAWGVRVFHDPLTDAWLAGTVNERNDGAWMTEVFDAVEEELR
ncbi:MAG: serine hydrolase domain-containing protein [Ilumatobacteraceae bacterium]